MSWILSALPFGSFKYDKSLVLVSEKEENPSEQIANTRLLILKSGIKEHLNL